MKNTIAEAFKIGVLQLWRLQKDDNERITIMDKDANYEIVF